MGVKGRDLLLYVFFISAFVFIAGRLAGLPVEFFSWVSMVSGVVALGYLPYIQKARRMSREVGLDCVVLLPLYYSWAELLIRSAGKKISGRGRRAFEVHVEVPGNLTLNEFLKKLDRDLNLARSKLPGSLFIWETSAPLPASIRKLIRTAEEQGSAFWEKGGWPLPRFPFTGRNIKKNRLRRGAILI
ncbi:hypothetical protein Desku_0843 [Desulfofundulus kuznetsovii DSM 6115]|uniref:Uncharacterized protein n=1 Tax=Desulfofundulus kuznetsovii (strain DSM 6115 / VKM B-1805 / 17) TaxID=760568 RepID=A0AAU8Q1B6_DESK7|nr:hypothetical protein Desku_0843 [Desulfofundulus kuznetsovii DSM 6115]